MTILEAVRALLHEPMSLQAIYDSLPDLKEHSIRARIYENLGKHFRRIEKGVYVATHEGAACVVVAGDAWEEIKKISTESVDALITDPPYPWINTLLAQGTTRKNEFGFETREIDLALGYELWRALKKGAHAFFFAPAVTALTKPKLDSFLLMLGKCGFQFNKLWVWDKVHFGMGYAGRARHETIVFASKGDPRKPFDLSIADVLTEPRIHISRRIHDAEKPVGLIERLVKFSTKAGETILDCFAGSLSTGVAALKLGRNSIMIEKALQCEK
jgi:site-specific DNA-methyltransferase (adenine-specific)